MPNQGLSRIASATFEGSLETQAMDPNQEKTKSSFSNVVLSCMIGNALEWYDFAIYGFFADIIGRLFFPNADPLVQLIASLGVFAAGFLARPIGAFVFGKMGDKIGRKDALLLSIYMMAIPTALIGCIPTYGMIGVAAPICLIVLRLFQGFAIGGEFTGSIVFVVEHSAKSNRGLSGSWACFSLIVGVLVGSGIATAFIYALNAEQLELWGWRVPFILSIAGSLVGAYMRRNLVDPKIYKEKKKELHSKKLSFGAALNQEWKNIGIVVLLDFLTAIGFFTLVIFLPAFFKTFLKMSSSTAQSIHTINIICMGVATIAGGALSDRYGRKNILKYTAIFIAVTSIPLFMMFQVGQVFSAFFVQMVLCIAFGLYFGVIPATLCEIFPTRTRFSGVSIGHNLSMAIFGGTAPMVATQLTCWFEGSFIAPAFMLVTSSALTLMSLKYFKDLAKKELP